MTDIDSKLDHIAEAVEKLQAKGPSPWNWLLPALIAALVAVGVAVLAQIVLLRNADREHRREIAEAQGVIVKEFGQLSFGVGEMLLRYRLRPLYETGDPQYVAFVSDIQGLRVIALDNAPNDVEATSIAVVSPQPRTSEAIPLVAEIQENFNSGRRLEFSDELIAKFAGRSRELAVALIGAILEQGDTRSYRVNLYIALTLARIPGGWPDDADPQKAVPELRGTANYKDRTFSKRVDEALKNMVKSAT